MNINFNFGFLDHLKTYFAAAFVKYELKKNFNKVYIELIKRKDYRMILIGLILSFSFSFHLFSHFKWMIIVAINAILYPLVIFFNLKTNVKTSLDYIL